MGLLDRVKQNQTGAPPVSGPASNGPATATAPGGASSYSTSSAVPKARVTDTAPPASAAATAARPPLVGEAPPAFTAAKVQIHAKLIERFADQIDSSNKVGVREKILELAEEYFRTTAMTMTKTDKERLVDSVLDDVLGLGPLEALLADPNITEIMANHPEADLRREGGRARTVGGHVRVRTADAPGHRPHRQPGRPPRRRIDADL